MKKSTIPAIEREHNIHGTTWQTLHGGYFSSSDVVAPLVSKIADVFQNHPVDTVIDLGGGTGFLLSNVATALSIHGFSPEFINMDLSADQLAAITDPRLQSLCSSITGFKRSELAAGAGCESSMFISRSTLHYYGKDGLRPALEHIRNEMRKGEFFIHQTACFIHQENAEVLNLIYKMMNSDKWYPAVDILSKSLEQSGFEITEIQDTAPLPLSSESLMVRYGISKNEILEITASILKHFRSVPKDVFEPESGGKSFIAHLHYKTFICRAI